MNVTLSDIIVLTIRKVFEEAQQSKGRYVSFKSSRLADDILKSIKVSYSRILIRYLVKHVLDVLCVELGCERHNTSRGTVYSFDKKSILRCDINVLIKKISEQELR